MGSSGLVSTHNGQVHWDAVPIVWVWFPCMTYLVILSDSFKFFQRYAAQGNAVVGLNIIFTLFKCPLLCAYYCSAGSDVIVVISGIDWQLSHGLMVRPINVIPHFRFCILLPAFRILPTILILWWRCWRDEPRNLSLCRFHVFMYKVSMLEKRHLLDPGLSTSLTTCVIPAL